MPNRPQSFEHVTSTVTLALASMIAAFRDEMPGMKFVYDEKLSYESAVEKIRADNNLNQENLNLFPLFAFKRSVLRHAETQGPGRRATGIEAKRNMTGLEGQVNGFDVESKTSNIYRLVHGEIDVQFLFVTDNVSNLEVFEVLYLSEEGISRIKELTVDLQSELGTSFTYYATYAALEDKELSSENMTYKQVSGSLTLRGFFPVLISNNKHILTINERVLDFLGGVYQTEQVKAP